MPYLLIQYMEFEQTCIDTMLEGEDELIDFDDLELILKVTIL